MLKNYFKIAWRNLFRNKVFTATNLLGLAIGMTCTILIFLWVHDELSYDMFLVSISPWLFLVVGLLLLLLTLLVVGMNTVRSAMRNPVNSLRSE